MHEGRLIDLYNVVTTPVLDGVRYHAIRPTKSAMRDAGRFLRWCEAEKVDPERWIRARHEAFQFKARIPLAKLSKATPAFMAEFRRWGDQKQAYVQGQATLAADAVDETTFAPARLYRLHEAMRIALSSAPGACMVSRDTGGWHPQSAVCPTCTLATRCRERLPEPTRTAREQCA